MKIINLNSRSVTIELESNTPYYNEEEYEIFLNDNLIRKEKRNIFTIYDLEPDSDYKIEAQGIINFHTPKEKWTVYLKDFNPYKDGINNDTAFLQAAIMATPVGGTLIIEEGTYLVTSLYLKSNVNIYLKKNARILASTNRRDYPIHPSYANVGLWEGAEVNNFSSTVNFIDNENVTIYGEGEIDGQAENGDWYINHRVMNIAWRGYSIFMVRSNNINIIGLYVHNTQAWAIHPYMSSNLNFYNLYIKNNPKMPTTDGIDPDCSNNIEIKGCKFSVGDDCIAIKSGTYDLALKYKQASSDILIENNLMADGHGGVVFGSESSGGIKNIIVRRCLFENTDRGLRIKTRRGRGNVGQIDNITFDDIVMNNVLTPFVINSYYNMGPKGGHEEYVWTTKALPVDEYTPVLGAFHFSNMVCNDVSIAAGVFLGLAEMPIKLVSFENVSFSYNKEALEGIPCMMEHPYRMKRAGIFCLNVEKLETKNVTFDGVLGDEIIKEWSR